MASIPVQSLETADEKALRRRGLTLFLLTVVYFFSFMDRYILSILLELIKADLKVSDFQLGLLSGFAFAIFYAGLGIPVAWLADRRSRRDIIVVALTIWSAMTALCGFAQNYTQLLLCRIGVGIGEAGASPPSHSMIADLYPPDKRTSAMAIYATGVVLGGGLGTMIGGAIASAYGWRWAMMAVGLPGILLAVIVRLFVIEPRRGLSDPGHVHDKANMPTMRQGFSALLGTPAAIHLIMAVTVTSLIGYATGSFTLSYFQRSFGVSVLTISLVYAPVVALIGGVTGVIGGRLADAAARRWGMHAQAWLVAVFKLCALPFGLTIFLGTSLPVVIAAFMLNTVFASSYLGPSFSLIQGLAPIRMRAVWAAITMLVINLIGLGLGPTMTGVISDLLRPSFGEESLRYALLTMASLTPWAIFHFWRAGVLMKRTAAPG